MAVQSKKVTKKKSNGVVKRSQKNIEIFVEHYFNCGFNATQAFKKAFPEKSYANKSSLYTQSSQFFKHNDTQQYLLQRIEERKKELMVDQTYVVRKLTEIVESDFVDATQYLTKDQLDRMPENLRKLVVSIDSDSSTHTWNDRYGNQSDHEEITEKYKVTFMSKDKALDGLAKHTGTYMKDNVSLNKDMSQKSFTEAVKELDI